MTQRFLFLLLVGLSLSVKSFAQTAPTPQAKVNIIIDRESVRFAPQELAVEMRLVVTDQSGAEVYDSGPLSLSTLDWLMRDSNGEAVKGGLYLYKLSLKDANGGEGERRGYLIVTRTGDADRVFVATGDKVGIGAGGEVTQVTVVSNAEATVGGAELPGRVPLRAGAEERGELPKRASSKEGQASAPTGPHITLATAGRLAKFNDASGNLVDSGVLETLAGGGLVQTFGNTGPTVGAYNHVVEIVAASGKTPLTLVGGAGAMEFWRDNTPSAAVAFGVAKPAIPAVATNDMIFSAYSTSSGGWFERMRLTNSGNLGIGTTDPQAKLHVSGGAAIFDHPAGAIRVAKSAGGLSSDDLGIWNRGGNGGQPFAIADWDTGAKGIFINTNTGNVGIGASNPLRTFQIGESSDAAFTFEPGSSPTAGFIRFGDNTGWTLNIGRNREFSGGPLNTGTSGVLFQIRDNGETFIFGPIRTRFFTGGTTSLCRTALEPSAQAYIRDCSSSLRYKTDVQPFAAGLEFVRRLRPISFMWKSDGTRDLGLAAEDVAQVEPRLVTYNLSGDVEGVKYDHLNVVLINAIKEQQAQLQQQQKLIKQLQARLKRVERRTKHSGEQR